MDISSEHPLHRHIYAVLTGLYVGEMLVFINSDDDNHHFISIPKNTNRVIPFDKFDLGMDENILDHVGDLPEDLFQLLEKQFDFNETLGK